MSSASFGIALLLVFSFSQAARDVFFASALQVVPVALVAAIAFGLTVVLFGALAQVRGQKLGRLLSRPREVLLLNVSTAMPWISYLIALQHLEPAVAWSQTFGGHRTKGSARERRNFRLNGKFKIFLTAGLP